MTNEKLAYRPAEAATALGISLRKLRELLSTGELPHRRVGTRILISRGALDAFLGVVAGGGAQ